MSRHIPPTSIELPDADLVIFARDRVKILYISQYFPPEMGAPAARADELSRHWASMGHEVTVLTGFPNHPTGVVPAEYRSRFRRLVIHRLRRSGAIAQLVACGTKCGSDRCRRTRAFV